MVVAAVERLGGQAPDTLPTPATKPTKNKIIRLGSLPLYIAAARDMLDVNVAVIGRPGSSYQLTGRTEERILRRDQGIVAITATPDQRKLLYRKIKRLQREERLRKLKRLREERQISLK